jgi:very-short-patch-repair endonuclease
MSWNTYKYLQTEYETKGRSTGSIAKEHGTYANTVRRALIKHKIPLRTKSQAQKNFIDKNGHPMLGVARSDETKQKISEGIQDHFDSLTNEELDARRDAQSERASQKWEAMTDKERKKNIAKMHKANRENSGMGSKNENLVAQMISNAGYKIVQRSTDYSPRNQFEIDIAIPSESIAIEWDGAAHFEPIYGNKNLRRVIAKDSRKDKALTEFGWTVIRCRDHSTAHSLAFCRRAVNQIIDTIKTAKRGVVHKLDVE